MLLLATIATDNKIILRGCKPRRAVFNLSGPFARQTDLTGFITLRPGKPFSERLYLHHSFLLHPGVSWRHGCVRSPASHSNPFHRGSFLLCTYRSADHSATTGCLYLLRESCRYGL